MLLLIVWSGFYIPFNLSFGDMAGSTDFLDLFSWLTDFAFITDVILNFFTAFKDGALVITDKKKIAERYILSWFIIDLVASIPLERFSNKEQANTNKLLRLMR